MENESSFDPELFDFVLSLHRGHVFPLNVVFVLYFETAAEVLRNHIFRENFTYSVLKLILIL